MNQISNVTTPVTNVSGFVDEAREKMAALGYDPLYTAFKYIAFRGHGRWEFCSHETRREIVSIAAPTLAECFAQARDWLANLTPEEQRLNAYLGIKS